MSEAIQKAREALREMIYETTHLSPEEADGAHKCIIPARALSNARSALAALDAETEVKANLTRPIIGIENRTAQEAFDIMCDRIRSAFVTPESRS